MSESEKSLADVALEGFLNHEENFQIFYKYQSINDYSIDALANGYQYFSTFAQLNDPFDPFLSLMAKSLGDSKFAEVANVGPRIFCLTEHCTNAQMWAHYANSGSGMCIGYACFIGTPRILNPVNYVGKVPESADLLELLSLKHESWTYEKEWRITWAGGDQKIYDVLHPVTIYLGPRCSNDDMLRVRQVLPATVTEFEIMYPHIENGVFSLARYSIEELLSELGHLPSIDELTS